MEGSNPLFIAELQQYNSIEEECQFTKLYQQLNTDQVVYFDTVVAAIDTNLQVVYFFLQSPAGTNKTFLYYCVSHYYYLCGKIIFYIAFLGITALLLPSRCIAHSCFQILFNLHKEFTCNISKSSNLAKLLQRTSLLIQDKVPMQYRYCFKAVHCILTDVRFNKFTFGGLPTILGSDFT